MTLMKIETLILWVVPVLAAGGCSVSQKPVQPSAVDGGVASRWAHRVNRLDEASRMLHLSPPDLSGCTRMEITLCPSTLRALGLPGGTSILSPEEVQYLESMRTMVVDDLDRIMAFAKGLRSGSYAGTGERMLAQETSHIVCYRGDEYLLSLEKYALTVRTEEGHYFRYSSGALPTWELMPNLYPFYLRGVCASNLYRLGVEFRAIANEKTTWPGPYEWCDVLSRCRAGKNPGTARELRCPSAGEGKSHYAMNPKCKADSPADTVLLFETKAGWNQHGSYCQMLWMRFLNRRILYPTG